MNTQTAIFKNELLQNFADLLKSNGFDVYYHPQENGTTWIKFVKDNKIGECQLDYFDDRLRFSTCHKGNRNCGTGFGLHQPYEGTSQPTIQDAERAFIIAPSWANRNDVAAVVKYKSWNDYLSNPVNRILNYEKY